jgi:uncharacterized membrane protein
VLALSSTFIGIIKVEVKSKRKTSCTKNGSRVGVAVSRKNAQGWSGITIKL